ncbi:MAG: hypothetical protein E6Q56_08590, partial [Mycobacterium sp.]
MSGVSDGGASASARSASGVDGGQRPRPVVSAIGAGGVERVGAAVAQVTPVEVPLVPVDRGLAGQESGVVSGGPAGGAPVAGAVAAAGVPGSGVPAAVAAPAPAGVAAGSGLLSWLGVAASTV